MWSGLCMYSCGCLVTRVPRRSSQQTQGEDANAADGEQHDDHDTPGVAVDVGQALELDEDEGVADDHAELEHGPEYPRVARHGRLVGVQREEDALRRPDDGRAHAEHGGEAVEGDGVGKVELKGCKFHAFFMSMQCWKLMACRVTTKMLSYYYVEYLSRILDSY